MESATVKKLIRRRLVTKLRLVAGVVVSAAIITAAAAKYTVVDQEFSDTPIKTQIVQYIVVDGMLTKTELEAELLARYRAALARRGFRYHNPATNIFIYVYASREQARAHEGQIGMLLKNYGSEPKTLIDEKRLAALGKAAEDRFGLPEPRRKQVFREIVAAEGRAAREAMARIPNSRIIEQIELERQLQKKYKSVIAQQYKLSEAAMKSIVEEGATMGWPSR
jgi:hypothetical protein